MKYRKRPVDGSTVVDAERFDGTLESAMRICGPGGTPDLYYGNPRPGDWSLAIFVVTPRGLMTALAGSWIVTGDRDDRHVVEPTVFEADYVAFDPSAPATEPDGPPAIS